MFKLLKHLFKGPFIADLPPGLMQCELGCKALQCNQGQWQSCENRIRRMNEEIAFSQNRSCGDPAANQLCAQKER
jgi:hypothetical protein